MRIGILGCGAIGGLFLGYLTSKEYDVRGVVRPYQKESLIKDYLFINGIMGNYKYKVNVDTCLNNSVDLAIVATKLNNLEEIIEANINYLKQAVIVTVQNGMNAEYILNQYFPKENIISGIVMFNASFSPPNHIFHVIDGELVIGNIFGVNVSGYKKVANLLGNIFKTSILDDIKGAKYTKLFINLSNCISAILGLSLQETFLDLDMSELAMQIKREAYYIIKRANINLCSLPNYPKEILENSLSIDIKAASVQFSRAINSLSDKPIFCSMLQSIKRSHNTEVDYINGDILNIAYKNNLKAPFNERIVNLVHIVEDTGKFCTKKELINYFIAKPL